MKEGGCLKVGLDNIKRRIHYTIGPTAMMQMGKVPDLNEAVPIICI